MREFKRRLDLTGRRARTSSACSTRCPTTSRCAARAKGQSVGPKTILRYVKLLAEIPRGKMVQVRITGCTPTIGGASVVVASPESIHTAVQEFLNPNPALSQAIASRFGGKVVGGAKKPAKKVIKGPSRSRRPSCAS